MSEQVAPPRATEGPRPGAVSRGKGASTGRRGPGRPKGSTNKSKSLVPTELADALLLSMRAQLPKEHFEYVRGVIKEGKAVSTKNELQTLILLLSRNLWAAMIDEMRPPAAPESFADAEELLKETGETGPGVYFRRDVTDRLKVLTSLLNLLHQIEKQDAENKGEGENPLVKIWASRGMQGRVAVLINNEEQPKALPAGTVVEGTATELP